MYFNLLLATLLGTLHISTSAMAQEDLIAKILRANISTIDGIGSNGSACQLQVKNRRQEKLLISYGDMFGQYEARFPTSKNKDVWIFNADKNEVVLVTTYGKSVTFAFSEVDYLFRHYTVILNGTVENKCWLNRI